ncbi:phosphotransferase-like protein [Psychromonas hadalis]|nr:hypothetical protein [Psychromonas hadalis]
MKNEIILSIEQLPQIILLNGTGRSGKTTLAKLLQEDLLLPVS